MDGRGTDGTSGTDCDGGVRTSVVVRTSALMPYVDSMSCSDSNDNICDQLLVVFYLRCALGMCKRCGNLRMIACKKCKGAGLIREGSLFGLTLLDDSKLRSSSCTNCQGRGHFSCPECSKSSV
ncbi:hypothetical protein TIFTF001_026660 [Ficus carica]|uniref:Uncharacterized protein n=1 Tax=Ficus carica TaxID=3494 RepID=A0AA88DMF7_FICCA|nr:hypothetical protein TIFTF001_026660 [Ficus carica]